MAKTKHRKLLATKRLQAKTTAKQDISAECIKLVMDRNKQSGIDNWKILQKVTIIIIKRFDHVAVRGKWSTFC